MTKTKLMRLGIVAAVLVAVYVVLIAVLPKLSVWSGIQRYNYSDGSVSQVQIHSGDEFVVYTFDFSEHKKWNGTLRALRFDAFRAANGSFEIDYIRLIPKE